MQSEWLTREEVIFSRLSSFHHERVKALTPEVTTQEQGDVGLLIAHVIPESAVVERRRFESTELKKHGVNIEPLGNRSRGSRYNIDGVLKYAGRDEPRSRTQIFRDGRIESVMRGVANQQHQVKALRDRVCEEAMVELVEAYMSFAKAIGIEGKIWLFSSLVGCEGVRLKVDPRFGDYSEFAFDRSPVTLPEVELSEGTFRGPRFRAWCDALWQAGGEERSRNFDKDGNRPERSSW